MAIKDPIAEAKRYLANAKEILRDKAIKDGDYYTYIRYTRMAGKCMWKGSFIALKYALNLKASREHKLDIDDIKAAVATRDKKLINDVVEGYNIMQRYIGYDGCRSIGVITSGLERMNDIIAWCAENAPKPLNDTKPQTSK